MKTLFVIDASGYLYSSYYAIRNMSNGKGESTNALFGFIRSILKLIKDFHPDHLVAVFDGPNNGKNREALFPGYKAHRTEAPQDLPYQINWAHTFCDLMGVPFLNLPDVEADDTIGSIAMWASKKGAKTYLCTSDKDMAQLVNDQIFLLNTRKDNLVLGAKEVEEVYGVAPHQIIDLLALTGDASDNVPGLPGVGPKTAAAWLKEFGSLDELFNKREKLPEKKRSSLEEHFDQVDLSRRLVTIDCAVAIPQTEEFYTLKSPHLKELKAFYQEMNFNSLLKELPGDEKASKQELQETYQLVDDEESLERLMSHLQTQQEICFDTETTDIHPLRAELVGIGLGVKEGEAWYIPAHGNLGLFRVIAALTPLFGNQNIAFYGHNSKYDCHVLSRTGIPVPKLSFDTLLASYLLNTHNRQHSLDTLALQYFEKVKIPIEDLIGKGKQAISMKEVAIDKVCTYCCEDVDYTCRLKHLLEKELTERGLDDLMYQLELPLLKVLFQMEQRGIFLDTTTLKKTAVIVMEQLQVLEKKIYHLAGKEFNINSPKQLSDILQHTLHISLSKKTTTGFSTSADILEDLAEKHPIAQEVLNYRSLEKLRSTYLETLPEEINKKTGRIHCTFNQSVTATGRLSCQNPNLQNIPVRTEMGSAIREAFRPENIGWSYLSADYSQIELRLLAHFSEDPNMIRAFQHQEDIHASTAATIFNIPLHEVTKEQRHHAKAVNFGIIYGQQAFGLAKELKISVSAAAAFIEAYFKRFNHVKEYLEACKEKSRHTGKAVTFLGRERTIPEIHSKNPQMRTLAERLAVNTPLQGTAADLIKKAMIAIDTLLTSRQMKSFMILQIHDELIFEVPDSELSTLSPLVQTTMEGIFHLKVPLVVDISIGKNWKEC